MTALLFYARHVSWLRFCPLLVACHGYARFLCLSVCVAAFHYLAHHARWLRSASLLFCERGFDLGTC